MDSLLYARIKQYLQTRHQCDPHSCGAVVFNMRKVARMAGYDLDERFASAGLGAGPDAEAAAGIVQHATVGGGGSAVSDYVVKQAIDRWSRMTPGMGM